MREEPKIKDYANGSPSTNSSADIAKRPGRAALLGVLAVTMVAMSVRAFYELHPREPPSAPRACRQVFHWQSRMGWRRSRAGNADAKINENRELWNTLREKNPKAVDASAGVYLLTPVSSRWIPRRM